MSVGNLFRKNIEVIRYEVKEHLSYHKKWYTVIALLLLLGIVGGMIVGFSMKEISVSKIPEHVYQNYLLGKLNIIRLFFSRLFHVAIIGLLIFVSCLKKWLAPFGIVLLIYKAFSLGVTIALIILLFNVWGVLSVLFLIMPCYILLLILGGVWFEMCIRHCFTSYLYGGSVFSREFWCMHKRLIIFLLVCVAFLMVLEMIMLPLMSSTLLVVKS